MGVLTLRWCTKKLLCGRKRGSLRQSVFFNLGRFCNRGHVLLQKRFISEHLGLLR